MGAECWRLLDQEGAGRHSGGGCTSCRAVTRISSVRMVSKGAVRRTDPRAGGEAGVAARISPFGISIAAVAISQPTLQSTHTPSAEADVARARRQNVARKTRA